MKKNLIVISEGERPIWQIIIATFFYTLGIGSLLLFFYQKELVVTQDIAKYIIYSVEFSFYLFALGFGFSVVKNVVFNLEENTYKDEYAVGPIRYGKWRKLPKINYVSVFKQPMVDDSFRFEVNLWYEKNKHFNIYMNNDYDLTLEMGFHIAHNLNVKLLDATIPNNYKYVDLDELNELYN